MTAFCSTYRLFIAFALALIAAFTAITNQSFWIDEANSAVKATQPTLQDFGQVMKSDANSDLQMPLYMVALWGWEKWVGSSEWNLRSLNLPFFVLSLLAWMALPKIHQRLIPWLWLSSASSAFLWFYLDEARPYVLQYLGSVCLVVSVLRFKEGINTLNSWILFYTSCFIVCGSSLLGVPFAGCSILLVIWLVGNRKAAPFHKDFPWIAITSLFLLVMVGLTFYFAWTFLQGARASTVGQTDVKNLFFAFYELTGLSGLGPGRMLIRDLGVRAFIDWLPLLAPTILCLGLVLYSALKKYRIQGIFIKQDLALLVISIVIPTLFIFLLGWKAEFRVLGRHLTPLLPWLLLGFSWVVWTQWHIGKQYARILVVVIFAMLSLSCLGIRFNPAHAKDDYRGASEVAYENLVKGGVIWWAADRAAAHFYQLPVNRLGRSLNQNLVVLHNPEKSFLENSLIPAVIILGRTDVYDPSGQIGDYIKKNQYKVKKKLSGFSIYSQ
ncbi:MAG: hypothetical protein SH807_03290 [Blastochloris sp.]|nr:hypothetical protein [Blastochloris sp.]